jgi:hypothetical protein
MIKHVGQYKNKRVVIVFREVPNEEDQCLVVYPDQLPSFLHDEMMTSLESEAGQQSNSINEVFFRTPMADGRMLLTSLHTGGHLAKVPTKDVTVTPTTNKKENVQLDVLNDMIRKLASGEPMGRDLGEPTLANEKVLTDNDLADSQRKQAAQMKAEAKRLIEEAERLEKEAQALAPKNVRTTKKTTTKKQKAAA